MMNNDEKSHKIMIFIIFRSFLKKSCALKAYFYALKAYFYALAGGALTI